MGGRGGGSGRGSSALDTKDVGELRQYMQDHYSVTVHSSADKVDFGVLRSAAGELEGLLKECPQAAIGIHELNGSESRSNAYASASLSGKLQLNPKMMGDQAKLDQNYENDVRVKWHKQRTYCLARNRASAGKRAGVQEHHADWLLRDYGSYQRMEQTSFRYEGGERGRKSREEDRSRKRADK